MNRTEALEITKDSITRVVPDADVTRLAPDDAFRDTLELDSLDFLSFVEILSESAGVRIDDEDAPRLATLSGCADFLVARTA